MKKFILTTASLLIASTASAQDESYEMARLGITMNGFPCESIETVVPTDNDDVIEITCIEHAGRSATVIYIFTISGSEFSITPK